MKTQNPTRHRSGLTVVTEYSLTVNFFVNPTNEQYMFIIKRIFQGISRYKLLVKMLLTKNSSDLATECKIKLSSSASQAGSYRLPDHIERFKISDLFFCNTTVTFNKTLKQKIATIKLYSTGHTFITKEMIGPMR